MVGSEFRHKIKSKCLQQGFLPLTPGDPELARRYDDELVGVDREPTRVVIEPWLLDFAAVHHELLGLGAFSSSRSREWYLVHEER